MSARTAPAALAVSIAIVIIGCSASPAPASQPPAGSPARSPGGGTSGGSGSPPPSSSGPSPSPATASLLLKVTSEGGFINPVATLNALPLVEVYDDGRILTPAPVPAIAPGPLLPTEILRNVGPAGAASIVAAIRAAGLDQTATTGPGIPGDSGSDVFVVTLGGQTTETRVSGSGSGVGGPGIGGSPAPGEAAALDLLGRLVDPSETWGASAAAGSSYQPEGYRVYAAPGAPTTDPSIAREPVPWPLAAGLSSFGTPAVPDRGVAGLRQGVVLGADAGTLGPVLERATEATGFTSDGMTWTLYVRPLLPDELGG